jgi:hypothetical protein
MRVLKSDVAAAGFFVLWCISVFRIIWLLATERAKKTGRGVWQESIMMNYWKAEGTRAEWLKILLIAVIFAPVIIAGLCEMSRSR